MAILTRSVAEAAGERQTASVRRLVRVAASSSLVLIAGLYVPDAAPPSLELPQGHAFVWAQDELWAQLEKDFEESKERGCPADFKVQLEALTARLDAIEQLESERKASLSLFEEEFFTLVAQLGGCPTGVPKLIVLRGRILATLHALREREGDKPGARSQRYRLVYGTRLAIEELLLQMPPSTAPALTTFHEEASQTPAAMVEGVTIHSGDLLVSRGGAPTSAFIARGNDYPGNFSHVALVHIDETTQQVSVIESHIESGVGVFGAAEYLGDKKLRILVLRPRASLSALQKNPLLPHHAATAALEQAKAGHIAYDFAMNVGDSASQFCSEVASSAYATLGIDLWEQPSRFSSPGLARWMSNLGVRHLSTYGPSDLEYDPQLRTVAEWHDPATLFDDHVDNAVIDAMLERAEAGAKLDHNSALLPLARLTKAYSWMLNQLGMVGPIPEGMSSTVALRAEWLTNTHQSLKADVLGRARRFEATMGYRAPYWRLVDFAREAAAASGALEVD